VTMLRRDTQGDIKKNLMTQNSFKRIKSEPPDVEDVCELTPEQRRIVAASQVVYIPGAAKLHHELYVSSSVDKQVNGLWNSTVGANIQKRVAFVPPVDKALSSSLFDNEEVVANTVIYKMTEDPGFSAFRDVFLISMRNLCCFNLGYPQFRLRGYEWSGGLRMSKLRSFCRFLRCIFRDTEFDHPFEKLASYADWGIRCVARPNSKEFLYVDRSRVDQGDICELFSKSDPSKQYVSLLVTDDTTVLFMWMQYFATYRVDIKSDSPVLREEKLFSPGVLHAILCVC